MRLGEGELRTEQPPGRPGYAAGGRRARGLRRGGGDVHRDRNRAGAWVALEPPARLPDCARPASLRRRPRCGGDSGGAVDGCCLTGGHCEIDGCRAFSHSTPYPTTLRAGTNLGALRPGRRGQPGARPSGAGDRLGGHLVPGARRRGSGSLRDIAAEGGRGST